MRRIILIDDILDYVDERNNNADHFSKEWRASFVRSGIVEYLG